MEGFPSRGEVAAAGMRQLTHRIEWIAIMEHRWSSDTAGTEPSMRKGASMAHGGLPFPRRSRCCRDAAAYASHRVDSHHGTQVEFRHCWDGTFDEEGRLNGPWRASLPAAKSLLPGCGSLRIA